MPARRFILNVILTGVTVVGVCSPALAGPAANDHLRRALSHMTQAATEIRSGNEMDAVRSLDDVKDEIAQSFDKDDTSGEKDALLKEIADLKKAVKTRARDRFEKAEGDAAKLREEIQSLMDAQPVKTGPKFDKRL